MANLSFDFNNIKRTFFNVKLKDGQALQVKMPKKKTFSKITALQELQNDENASTDDVMDTMAGIMAECLSNNMNGVEIKSDTIAEEYDIEEIQAFIAEYYSKFIGGIADNPN